MSTDLVLNVMRGCILRSSEPLIHKDTYDCAHLITDEEKLEFKSKTVTGYIV